MPCCRLQSLSLIHILAVVKADGIRFYDAFGKPVEREVLTADWDEEAAEKGGYPHRCV